MFARSNKDIKFYLYASPIDFRGSINRLVQHVITLLQKEPQNGDVYLFYNRGKDKLKGLFWDNTGFVLYYKRMERRKFIISKLLNGEVKLTAEECQLLLAGFDFTLKREGSSFNFSHYF